MPSKTKQNGKATSSALKKAQPSRTHHGTTGRAGEGQNDTTTYPQSCERAGQQAHTYLYSRMGDPNPPTQQGSALLVGPH
mgnify:CR=1 FL=1